MSSDKNEAPRSNDRSIFSPLLRRERNPSEAETTSHSSTSLHSWFSAKGDETSLLAKAEENFCNSLKQHKELGIYVHVGHATVLSNLARTLEAQGKRKEAQEIYRECLDIAQETNQQILSDDAQAHLTALS